MNINPTVAKIINYDFETNKSFCPTCKVELHAVSDDLRCLGCPIRFRVNKTLISTQSNLSLISFYLEFNTPILIELHSNEEVILIYSNTNKLTTDINVPMFDLDFSNLDNLKKKIKIYITFS